MQSHQITEKNGKFHDIFSTYLLFTLFLGLVFLDNFFNQNVLKIFIKLSRKPAQF